MTENSVYKLEIFGLEFPLTTKDGNGEQLKRISEYYKRAVTELQKKSPNLPHLNIAVLAGITLTDELYNLAKSKNVKISGDDKKVDELLNEALKQLEIYLNI